MHCHVPCGSGPYLPTEVGSSAATCHTAPDPASLLTRAPVHLCVPPLQTMPPCLGGLQCYHMSRGSGPRLPTQQGSDTATCPTTIRGPHALRIKKGLANLPMQLGSYVSKACAHVSNTPDIRAIMGLQDVRQAAHSIPAKRAGRR
jgi:hypothetical protein